MHAYCLISASGRRGARATVRPPQEMDQPPAFKTRRSNTVQNRRLALQVSLLERHMVALATERARAIRQLHEELRQLRVTRLPMRLSPCHAQIVGDVSQKFVSNDVKALPKLIFADKRSVFSDAQIKSSVPAQQGYHKEPEGFSSNLTSRVVAGNLPDCVSEQDLSPIQGHLSTYIHHIDQSYGQNVGDGTDKCPKSIPVTTNFDAQVFQQDEQQGGSVRLRRTSNDKDASYSVSNKRALKQLLVQSLHRSLANPGLCQCQSERQHTSSQDTEEQTSEVLEKQTEQHILENESPDHVTANPKLLDPRADETERPAQELRPRRGELEPELKQDTKNSRQKPAVTLSESVTTSARSPSSSPYHGLSSKVMGGGPHCLRSAQQRSLISKSLPCPLAGGALPPHSTYRCRLFPCAQPHTYHSLGFHPDPSSHPWRGWIAQNTCRPHHRLAPGRPLPPVGMDGRRTPADAPGYTKRKRMGKEEVVMLDMARKKQLHALARPPSWNTNYGQPTPYKRLKNPVMCKPTD